MQPDQKVGGGRFTLVKPLGRGGMGEVWLAQDERLHEPVALKFLPPEIRGDARALDDLRRETARSHRLTHTNIIRIHDLNEVDGEPAFIAMEFIDGPTLTGLQMNQPDRVLGWDFLTPLVQQLCAALDYAHGESVVHRDLKPANIMVDGKGRLKLADFGIAATVSDSVSRVSLRHATSGTLLYMSPQQLAGKRPQASDDIYALGATLYELLTSQPPFFTGDITHQVLHEIPEPLQERLAALGIQNDVPPDVAAIIMACLAKDPAQRPQSARAVAEWVGLEVVSKPSLQNLSNEMFGSASAKEPAGPSLAGDVTAPPSRSRRTLLVAGVAGAALILVSLGGWYWKTRPSTARGSPPLGQSEKAEPDSSSALVAAISDATSPTAPDPAATESDFVSLFNGHDLSGWDGDPRFWSVENGVLKGQSTEGNVPEGNNTYLIWTNGVVDDFELRLSYKLVYGDLGSGIQYRGRRITGWVAQGYQADFWPSSTGNSGLLAYEAPGGGSRPGFGRLAAPGEKVVWEMDGKKQVIGHTAKSGAEIQAAIKEGEWNEYVVTASGNHLVHQINGNIAMEMTDNDPQRRFMSGLLGLKMRNNKARPMLVYFKDIRLKPLSSRTTRGSSGLGAPEAGLASTTIALDHLKPGQFWTNSLGMVFVPVPGTKLLFSIWETRVQDFSAFVKETGYDATAGMLSLKSDGWRARGDNWGKPGFVQGPTHPVCGVNRGDAQAFCEWLRKRERQLIPNRKYRLPRDSEWSVAVGSAKYPWGQEWPPPGFAGNYSGEEAGNDTRPSQMKGIAGFRDNYMRTAPVGSFRANAFGLYDLGGNVWEWCEDWYTKELNSAEARNIFGGNNDGGGRSFGVLRGASWKNGSSLVEMQSDFRAHERPETRRDNTGFRCVLASEAE